MGGASSSCRACACDEDVSERLVEQAETEGASGVHGLNKSHLETVEEHIRHPCLPFHGKPRLQKSLSYAYRVALMFAFAKALPWLLVSETVPKNWVSDKCLPTLVFPLVLTSLDNLGTTLTLGWYATVGVLLALIDAEILFLLPFEDNLYIAILNFFLFTIFVLSLNTHLNVKVFAFQWASRCSMMYANPKEDFKEFFAYNWHSENTGLIMMHFAGVTLAVMSMLFPFPLTAFSHAKRLACSTAKETANLLVQLADYYTGVAKSFTINICGSTFADFREDSQALHASVDIIWWEGFDFCCFGPRRAMLVKQLMSLQKVARRLIVIQDCAVREAFEEDHKKVMDGGLREEICNLSAKMGNLMLATTVTAIDGNVAPKEREYVAACGQRVQTACEMLTTCWREKLAVLGYNGLEQTVRTESFFVSELSRVADQTIKFSTAVLEEEAKGSSLQTAKKAICKFFDFTTLKNPKQFNFVLRNTVSLSVAFLFGIFIFDYDTVTVGNIALMLSTTVGGAIPLGLKRVQGTVLGLVTGNMMVQYLTISNWVPLKCFVLFVYELLPLFIRHFSTEHRIVGTLLAMFGGKVLMVKQDRKYFSESEEKRQAHVEEQGYKAYHMIYQLAVGLIIVTAVDVLLNRVNSRQSAVQEVFAGMDEVFTNFKNFMTNHGGPVFANGQGAAGAKAQAVFDESDLTLVARSGEAHFQAAEALAAEAHAEPVCLSGPFPIRLALSLTSQLREIAESMHSVKLAFLIIDNEKEGCLYELVSTRPAWPKVQDQILRNMDQVSKLIKSVLDNTATDPKEFSTMRAFGDLEGLEELVTQVSEEVKSLFDEGVKRSKTLADDRVNRLAAVFEILETVHNSLNHLTSTTIENL